MPASTVRVIGLREAQRAFNRLDKGLASEMRAAGKAAAEPVVNEGRRLISRYQGASVNTIVARSNLRGAFVVQNARKVTGLRPDYGALQLRRLYEALDAKREEVLSIYEEQLDMFTAAEF